MTLTPFPSSPPTPLYKKKDGLIRMLLQNATTNPPVTVAGHGGVGGVPPLSTSGITLPTASTIVAVSDPPDDVLEDEKYPSYIYQISGCERKVGLVMLDHSYSKPYNWRPDSSGASKPTKTIFVPRISRNPHAVSLQHQLQRKEEYIDVDDIPIEPLPAYDAIKAKTVMIECERFLDFANPNAAPEDDNWEERVSKEGWTPAQVRLFNKVMKVLHADRLARLAQEGVFNEPIYRRLAVDKAAKRFRLIFASVLWDLKLTQWLHNTMTQVLPQNYLGSYLNVLQTLRAKVPSLVDKMIAGKVLSSQQNQIAKEGMKILLKRPWDPAMPSVTEQKLKHLPRNPILVLIPNEGWTRRSKRWSSMLSALGKLIVLDPLYEANGSDDDAGGGVKKMDVASYLHLIVGQTIARIRELKRSKQDRPLILIGWGAGAAICCQVAAMENITSCICLGFPMFTIDGVRGESDDPIIDLKSSILFIVGQNATLSKSDDIEDMRERMKVETGLLIVGGADDQLRVSKNKKKLEGITQSMVDRCIVDEIREFLVSILTAPLPGPSVPPTMFAVPNYPGVDLNGGIIPTVVGLGSGRKGSSGPRQRKRPSNVEGGAGGSQSKKSRQTSPANAASKPLQTTPITLKIAPPPPPLSTVPQLPSIPSKTVSCEDLMKARKMLDMSAAEKMAAPSHNQGHSPIKNPMLLELPSSPIQKIDALGCLTPKGAPPNIMGNSPLLTSALTSTPTSSVAKVLTSPMMTPQRATTTAAGPTVATATMLKKSQPRMQFTGPGKTTSNVIMLSPHPVAMKTAATSTATAMVMMKNNPNVGSVVHRKENLYIVSVPPDQLRQLDTNNIIQYQNQVVTLVTKGEHREATVPQTKDKDRRNVAEILASLSGLLPEPAAAVAAATAAASSSSTTTATTSTGTITTATTSSSSNLLIEPVATSFTINAVKSTVPASATTTTKAAILSSMQLASGPNTSRIVRVLQTGNIRASNPTTATATNTSTLPSSSPATYRSRKQVFITTTATATLPSMSPVSSISCSESKKSQSPSAAQGTSGSETSTTVSVDEDTRSCSPKSELQPQQHQSEEQQNYEQDILEEDLNDLEYKPYAKKRKEKGRNTRGKKI